MILQRIDAELHVVEGVFDYDPLRIALVFVDGSILRLHGTGDGETMRFDRLPLEEPFETVRGGRTEIVDFTDRLNSFLRGASIGTPCAIERPGGTTIGLALPREDHAAFCIWIDGDEFRWGDRQSLDNWDFGGGPPPVIGGPARVA